MHVNNLFYWKKDVMQKAEPSNNDIREILNDINVWRVRRPLPSRSPFTIQVVFDEDSSIDMCIIVH